LSDAAHTIAAIFRIELPKLVARLARVVRDVGRAEELAHCRIQHGSSSRREIRLDYRGSSTAFSAARSAWALRLRGLLT
jgi:hypothetical protein